MENVINTQTIPELRNIFKQKLEKFITENIQLFSRLTTPGSRNIFIREIEKVFIENMQLLTLLTQPKPPEPQSNITSVILLQLMNYILNYEGNTDTQLEMIRILLNFLKQKENEKQRI